MRDSMSNRDDGRREEMAKNRGCYSRVTHRKYSEPRKKIEKGEQRVDY